MLASVSGAIGSLLGPSEAERIQETLRILETIPDGVPLSKLMVRETGLWKGLHSIADGSHHLWTISPAKQVGLARDYGPTTMRTGLHVLYFVVSLWKTLLSA